MVKKHAGNVKFAVGMICYHTKFDYVGIVRAWDLSCDAKWADRMEMELNLEFGVDQPFYYLVAADQSARYVAQGKTNHIYLLIFYSYLFFTFKKILLF